MFSSTRRVVFLSALLAAAVLCAAPAEACNTPVFRYALENWPTDPYPVVVFHRGQLQTDQKQAVEYLRSVGGEYSANLRVYAIDVAGKLDEHARELFERLKDNELPQIVVTYPVGGLLEYGGKRIPRPFAPIAWSAPLTKANARAVVESPVRSEIAKRLLDGQTIVWVLVECGNRRADDAAAKLLAEQLARMSNELQLPEQARQAAFAGGPELRIEFSIVRIPVATGDERALLTMLLRLEEDLWEHHAFEPMAFPMYGRGRAIMPLVGKGINPQNIFEDCMNLVAACSCEVKRQNPGIDMLISADWEAIFEEVPIEPVPAPPVMSLAGLAEKGQDEAPDRSPADLAAPRKPDSIARGNGLYLAVLVLAAVGIVVGIALTLYLVARRAR